MQMRPMGLGLRAPSQITVVARLLQIGAFRARLHEEIRHDKEVAAVVLLKFLFERDSKLACTWVCDESSRTASECFLLRRFPSFLQRFRVRVFCLQFHHKAQRPFTSSFAGETRCFQAKYLKHQSSAKSCVDRIDPGLTRTVRSRNGIAMVVVSF